MKRQNSVWYIKVEGSWLPLKDYPFRSLTLCIISTILHKGATFVC